MSVMKSLVARRYLLPAGITAVVAVLLVAWVAPQIPSAAGAQSLPRPSGPPPQPQKIEVISRADIPQLSPEERAAAAAMLNTDPQLKNLLDGKRFNITSVGIWHDKNLKKLGAGLVVTLAEPASFSERDWPSVVFPEIPVASAPASTPYVQGTQRYGATNVKRLSVLVDLSGSTVMSITPGPGARVTLPPGTPRVINPHGH